MSALPDPKRDRALCALTPDPCTTLPYVEAAWLDRHQHNVSDGECGAKAAGVSAAHVDDDVAVLGSKLTDLGAQRGTMQADRSVAADPQ
ncbi:MAG: hypothetical protein M3Y22_01530 [Pseudomonadota bacterium]|nr:hypothetical protein [Pseudomonadota bacterium]